MPALIVPRCVGRSVYGMANESFDNLVTRKKKENGVSKEFVLGPSMKAYTVLCSHLIIMKGILISHNMCMQNIQRTYTSSAKSKLNSWCFGCSTLVANTVTTLTLVVKRGRVIIGGCRLCVVRHVEDGSVQTMRAWDNR